MVSFRGQNLLASCPDWSPLGVKLIISDEHPYLFHMGVAPGIFRNCMWSDNFFKVKSDHRSEFSNLSNWKEEEWKKSGLQQDSNPWPLRYRCDALHVPTELWSHTLGARSIYWVHIFRCSEMMWGLYEIIHISTAVVDESEEWSSVVDETEEWSSRWSPDFFQASSFQLLKFGKFTAMITLHFHLLPQY